MLNVGHPRRLDLSVNLHQHQSLLGIHRALGLKNRFNQIPTSLLALSHQERDGGKDNNAGVYCWFPHGLQQDLQVT